MLCLSTRQAVDRYQAWAKRYTYVLKLDISRYFPSIDHQRLKAKLRHDIKDQPTLALLDLIIDTSPDTATAPHYFPGDDLLTPLERRRGIPIGNLTSQFFANLYLNDFDHWIKEQLGVRAYWRYVDDFALLSDDKSQLAHWREAIRKRLLTERLHLHPHKAHITPTRHGLTALGYWIFPDFRRLRDDNGYHFRRRLKRLKHRYAEGQISWDRVDASIQAWIGHAQHARFLTVSGKASSSYKAMLLPKTACGAFTLLPRGTSL